MGGAVDSEGQAGDHAQPGPSQVRAKPAGHLEPVGGTPTGADDGHAHPVENGQIAPPEQHAGR